MRVYHRIGAMPLLQIRQLQRVPHPGIRRQPPRQVPFLPAEYPLRGSGRTSRPFRGSCRLNTGSFLQRHGSMPGEGDRRREEILRSRLIAPSGPWLFGKPAALRSKLNPLLQENRSRGVVRRKARGFLFPADEDRECNPKHGFAAGEMAERVGFEPTCRL